jgi:hypothetical protein
MRTPSVSGRALVLLVAAAVAVAAAVTLDAARLGEGREAARDLAVSSASYRWPVYTLRDWTDFADQLSVLRIESERQLPRSQDVVATGEGTVGRMVTARIEETLWRSPGSPTAPERITFGTWGWVAKRETLIPTTDSSSDRLAVGDRVLAALLLTPEGSWAPLSPSSTIRLVAGRTLFAARRRRSLPALAGALDGITPRAAADRLAAVEPRPDGAAFRRLDADERARALAAGLGG